MPEPYEPKPTPTPLPAPGAEHTAEGLAEKLYDCWAGYWKTEEKRPSWKDSDLSAKLRWRAVANLALSRGPFEDPDERIRLGEETRFAFQHVRDMAFADAPGSKPKDGKTREERDKEAREEKEDRDAKHPPVIQAAHAAPAHK
jgi:hypothetical protein